MDLATLDANAFAVVVYVDLGGGQQGFGDHSGGLVSVGGGKAHPYLEAGGCEDAAECVDRW